MKAVLSCGGTGGHIYPAIAIADKIRERQPDAEILFIGTKAGMENRLVPAAGYEIIGIDAKGIDRKNLLRNFETVVTYFEGSHEVKRILREFAPDAVIGTGGYVTGSVITQAHRLGIKCYIHEQNAVPGVANRVLSGIADKVFISFSGTEGDFRHPERVILTGNPVRKGFSDLDRKACRGSLGIGDDETMILVFGGSLGAEVINREAIGLIDEINGQGVKLYFVTGKRYYDEIRGQIEAKSKDLSFLSLIAYADNMPELMCASDIVVSRAGAIAVSEMTVCGKPGILIPSPNVTNNHQYHNAKAIADAGAAVLLQEKDLPEGGNVLAREILKLAEDKQRLELMAENSKKLGRTDAADIIYDNLEI